MVGHRGGRQETSIEVEVGFRAALGAEGIDELLAERDAATAAGFHGPHLPVLLAMSDNGPQMTSNSTAQFMALAAIWQHFGRPGTLTDQAQIESLNGHLKAEYPRLLVIRDAPPARRTRRRADPLQHRPAARRHRICHP